MIRKFTIQKDVQKSVRIDKIVAENCPQISRNTIQRLIEEDKIKVNEKFIKPSYKVKIGDEITIEEDAPKEIELKPEDMNLDVLYEDNDIIIINKPKGMVVHPGSGN